MFNKEGTGKYKISVCTNLPCALRNSRYTVEFLKELLGVEVGETTKDGLFTLLEGECFFVDISILDFDSKRVHLFGEMRKEKSLELYYSEL